MVFGPAVSGKERVQPSMCECYCCNVCVGVIADPVDQYDLPSSKFVDVCVCACVRVRAYVCVFVHVCMYACMHAVKPRIHCIDHKSFSQ